MRDWMKAARRKLDLTQEEVANQANCSRTLVTDIENGNATPSIRTAKGLANVLELDWTYFFTDESSKDSQENRSAS